MEVYRTPDTRFADLPDYPFSPHYAQVPSREGESSETLRLHYVDEGSPDAPPVLMLHGEPTWSFLYRKMIPALSERGYRAIAPDHIGFGKSDKPVDRVAYSFEAHINWIHAFVCELDLRDITLFVQDWGGPIGLAVLAREPDRFARVVASNTILHTADPDLAGRITWANHGSGPGEVCVAEGLLDWITFSQRCEEMNAGASIGAALAKPIGGEVLAGYDAPFPEERAKAGMRQFPILIPITRNDPGAAIDRATWEALASWEHPFLTLFGDSDPTTQGWQDIFQERVPGAAGQPHAILQGAGHFIQEDIGEDLARRVADWIETTPVRQT